MSGDVAADLRRRREASYRVEPLQDGRRDPMDPPSRAPNRRVLTVTVDDDRGLALVRGWAAKDLLQVLDLDPVWSASGRGWVIDSRHAPDVEALAQHERLIVVPRVVGGDS